MEGYLCVFSCFLCFDGTSVIFSDTYFESLKMTDVASKHVWKIKESCYVYTTIFCISELSSLLILLFLSCRLRNRNSD